MCYATPSALSVKGYESGKTGSTWHLRGPGYNKSNSLCVIKNGAVYAHGYPVDGLRGVRPVMWVEVE
ncbi:MAG: DUF6273 domain-containing protein [Lachnospiraceae bacterium]|nr:DUF6273 domain-containing protein [Lachnospiraceae bacterium]